MNKTKRLLSLFTAAALSVSAFAGLAVTAGAATNQTYSLDLSSVTEETTVASSSDVNDSSSDSRISDFGETDDYKYLDGWSYTGYKYNEKNYTTAKVTSDGKFYINGLGQTGHATLKFTPANYGTGIMPSSGSVYFAFTTPILLSQASAANVCVGFSNSEGTEYNSDVSSGSTRNAWTTHSIVMTYNVDTGDYATYIDGVFNKSGTDKTINGVIVRCNNRTYVSIGVQNFTFGTLTYDTLTGDDELQALISGETTASYKFGTTVGSTYVTATPASYALENDVTGVSVEKDEDGSAKVTLTGASIKSDTSFKLQAKASDGEVLATKEVTVSKQAGTLKTVTINYLTTETTPAAVPVPDEAVRSISTKVVGESIALSELYTQTVTSGQYEYHFNATSTTDVTASKAYTIGTGDNQAINIYFDKKEPVSSVSINYTYNGNKVYTRSVDVTGYKGDEQTITDVFYITGDDGVIYKTGNELYASATTANVTQANTAATTAYNREITLGEVLSVPVTIAEKAVYFVEGEDLNTGVAKTSYDPVNRKDNLTLSGGYASGVMGKNSNITVWKAKKSGLYQIVIVNFARSRASQLKLAGESIATIGTSNNNARGLYSVINKYIEEGQELTYGGDGTNNTTEVDYILIRNLDIAGSTVEQVGDTFTGDDESVATAYKTTFTLAANTVYATPTIAWDISYTDTDDQIGSKRITLTSTENVEGTGEAVPYGLVIKESKPDSVKTGPNISAVFVPAGITAKTE